MITSPIWALIAPLLPKETTHLRSAERQSVLRGENVFSIVIGALAFVLVAFLIGLLAFIPVLIANISDFESIHYVRGTEVSGEAFIDRMVNALIGAGAVGVAIASLFIGWRSHASDYSVDPHEEDERLR